MIGDNTRNVLTRIAAAAERSGRQPEDVLLVASTKGRALDEIDEAIRAGVRVIGENRVQEARQKYPHLKGRVKIHMIGHLQRNKVKSALDIFDLLHSVDSIRLAEEIQRVAESTGSIIPVLVEVNVSGEQGKYGLPPEEVLRFVERMSSFDALRTEGLMTLTPIVKDPEEARPVFRRLRELAREIEARGIRNVEMKQLSMGMTQDFEVAVEEGATMVRIGRAIFESGTASGFQEVINDKSD